MGTQHDKLKEALNNWLPSRHRSAVQRDRSYLNFIRTATNDMSLTETSLTERQVESRPEEDIYDDGYLRVEHKSYYVAVSGQPIKLPRTEFLIFSRLARTPQRIVTAEDLWQYAWGSEKPLNSESLHVFMYRLRGKLVPYSLQIETMINVGYRLVLSHQLRGQSHPS